MIAFWTSMAFIGAGTVVAQYGVSRFSKDSSYVPYIPLTVAVLMAVAAAVPLLVARDDLPCGLHTAHLAIICAYTLTVAMFGKLAVTQRKGQVKES